MYFDLLKNIMLFLDPIKSRRMNFKFLLAVPALLISGAAFAQQTNLDQTGGLGYVYSKKAPSEAATGTQYYIETFSPAKIDNANDVTLVRYNAYSDEMELKINDVINVLQPKDNQLITLTNGKATYQYVQYLTDDNVEKQNYLVIITNTPKFKVFKKERITLIPEQQPQGGYQKYKAPQYKKLNPEYYVQVNDGKVVSTSTKKKDIIKLFPGNEKQVEQYIKENKLNTSDEADLTKLGLYINSIL